MYTAEPQPCRFPPKPPSELQKSSASTLVQPRSTAKLRFSGQGQPVGAGECKSTWVDCKQRDSDCFFQVQTEPALTQYPESLSGSPCFLNKQPAPEPFSWVLLVKNLNLGRKKTDYEKSLPRLHVDSGVPGREEGTASAWGAAGRKREMWEERV